MSEDVSIKPTTHIRCDLLSKHNMHSILRLYEE